MLKYALFTVAMTVAGCAGPAGPVSFNGQHYMAGDSTCARITSLTPSRVMCHDSDGNETGWRDAMTPQDIENYFRQRQMQDQEMQNLNQSIQQVGTSLNRPQPQYNYKQVMPIYQENGPPQWHNVY